MNKYLILSRKRQLKFLTGITLIYVLIQIPVFFLGDTELSRNLWLEHKNVKEVAASGKPAKSEFTPILRAISDNHFWILRAALLYTIILAFYYKDKDINKYVLYRNISLSALLILFFASGIITWSLKILLGKPRPYTGLTEYAPFAVSTRFQSFPSGHTTETFSYLIPFIYFIKRYPIRIFLFLFGLIISFLRVFLSYHYISDVIFGMYITALTGYIICAYLENKSEKSYKDSQ